MTITGWVPIIGPFTLIIINRKRVTHTKRGGGRKEEKKQRYSTRYKAPVNLLVLT